MRDVATKADLEAAFKRVERRLAALICCMFAFAVVLVAVVR